MRETSFGAISEFILTSHKNFLNKFEVMYFNKPSEFHEHDHTEFAVLVEGAGIIEIKEPPLGVKNIECKKGSAVMIAPNARHRMVPDTTLGMSMVILYGGEPNA